MQIALRKTLQHLCGSMLQIVRKQQFLFEKDLKLKAVFCLKIAFEIDARGSAASWGLV